MKLNLGSSPSAVLSGSANPADNRLFPHSSLNESRAFVVPPYTILYDRREREAGWRFGEMEESSAKGPRSLLVKTREIHMVTADYTIEDADGRRLPILVERKSHDDLIGSCGGGHDRLRAEHERMVEVIRGGGHCCLVIETSLDRVVDELDDPTSTRKLRSSSIMGIIESWPQKYGVPWHFAGSRRLAERLCFGILSKFHDRWLAAERAKAIEVGIDGVSRSAPPANLF